MITNDDTIIIDPEGEYFPLVSKLGGQVIKLSPTSKHHINPMDINLDSGEDELSQLKLKANFILSLCELIIGGEQGLQPVERSIIDHCVQKVYLGYLKDPKPENMPTLQDLYEVLRDYGHADADYIATALQLYVTGSSNLFNNRTNELCYKVSKSTILKSVTVTPFVAK